MANSFNALNIANSAAVSITMSTGGNCSTTLSGGVYAVWAITQNGFIDIGSPLSTAPTVTNSFPIIAGQTPLFFNVPNNFQIGAVSTSSGALMYQQVG